MNFKNALNLMKSGYRMTRPGWSEGAFVSFVAGEAFKASDPPNPEARLEGMVLDRDGRVDFTMSDGSTAPFVALQGDLMADDWREVE